MYSQNISTLLSRKPAIGMTGPSRYLKSTCGTIVIMRYSSLVRLPLNTIFFATQGADPGVEASTGHTALTWAAVCGFDLVAAELLLGDNANSSASSTSTKKSGSSSMEDAIRAVTRTTAVEGKTALHNAALNGNSGVVVLLLDRLRDLLLRRR